MPLDVPTEIVVTARALEPARAEEPLATTTLDSSRVGQAGSTGLEQVLQQVAGVQLFRRSDARSANPTSQGITLRALGGNAASRALLILDGVPQTDPFGGWINWPGYDPLALAEVRVTRGGGSVADGPGALAGTIVLTSAGGKRTLAEVAGGSRESALARLVVGRPLAGGTALVAVRAERGDGFTPVTGATRGAVDRPAPYRNASGRLRWTGSIGVNTDLQLAASGFIDERSRGLPFTDNLSRGADASVRLIGRGRWQWSALAYAQRRRFESSFAATDAGRTSARRTSLQYDVPGRAVGWSAELRPPVGPEWEVRLGTDGRLTRGRSDEFGSYFDGAPTRDRSSGGRSSTAGAFAEASWSGGGWLLTGGARLDRFGVTNGSLRERLIATGALTQDVHYPDRSEWLPTARIGARLALGDQTALRGAAYLGWRPPTLNELFRPFRLGNDVTGANAELAPERLRGTEAGVQWRREGARLDLALFRNRLSDAIANVTIGTGPGFFPGIGFVPAGGEARQRQNLDRLTATGVEASGGWSLGPWSLSADASWTKARIADDGAGRRLTGLRPAQTPALAASASAAWNRPAFGGALQARLSGSQYEDDRNRIRLPGAVTLDGSLRIALNSRFEAVLRGENLLDAEVIAGRTDGGTEERSTPRTLWFGLRLLDVPRP